MKDNINEHYKQSDLYMGNPNLMKAGTKHQYTQEQIQEFLKCKDDPIYFIKKYVKIINVEKGLCEFLLYPYQEQYIKNLQTYRSNVSCWPRQSGKSTTTVAYFLWTICFDVEKIIGIFANKQATSVELLGRLKLAYEHLPVWLKSGIVIWNKTAIELDNGCRVMAFSTSSASARGFSFSQILIDEAAFIPPQMFQEFFESTIPVVASGKNTKITIVSTPNGFNHFYKIFNDSINGVAEYHPYKIEWNEVPGRDEEWKQEQIRKLGSLEAFEKEFACEFLGSSNTLFSKAALQSLSANNPVGTMNGVKIYEKPKEDHTYIITIDTAEGVGLDYSAFVISDVTEYPFRQVAVFHDNRVDALRLPNLIISTAKYYNDAFVFIELNSTGKQVADIIKYDLEYEYILHTRLIKNKLRLQYYGIGKNSVWNGLKQTRATKSVGCNTIKTLVESQKYIIQDMDTINEASTFVQNGFSYSAETGSHDDLMMCLVLFGWIATQGIFEEMSSRDIRKEVADSYEKEVEENLVFFIENSNKQPDNTFRDEQGIVWNVSGR